MRLIFLNRFYWPDEPATAQLLTDLAEHLAARGISIEVVTSGSRNDRAPREETRRGVKIVRVTRARWAGGGLAGKAAEWSSFLFAATWRLLRDARRGDVVVVLTDPPLLGIGAWLVSMMRGTRLFHWVQDIYPEIAIELTGHRWLAALRLPRNLAWRHAEGCVTLGTDMAAVLARNGVATGKISIVPNWGPAGLAPATASAVAALRHKWGLAGKFVVAYSGNLGRVHDLEPVLALAEALRGDVRFAIVFLGGGAQRAPLEAEAARRALSNVRFLPAQPRTQLAESLSVGDVHLVTLLPGCEHYVFPSKLYGIASVGRPVAFIGPHDCELTRLVTERNLGVAVERSQIAALAAALRALADDPTRWSRHAAAASAFSLECGGVAAAIARWERLLNPPGPAGPPRG